MKKIINLMMVLLLVLTMFSCGKTTQNDKFYNEDDPIQVVDGAGRKISFENPVQTIATSWGGTCDSYLFALGLQDRLVATNSKNDFHKLFIPNMDNMKTVGRWSLDKEALAAISPDLFIHGVAGTQYLNGANQVGVRALGLSLNTFEDIAFSIDLLGKVFGVEERAKYINEYCQSILNIVEERVKNISDEEKLSVVMLGNETGSVACDIYNTVVHTIVLAGGVSIVPDEIANKTEITNVGLETIFKWNPDVIFLQSAYTELTEEGIMNDVNWQHLNSVENNRVFTMPCDLNSWSDATPSSCLGVLYMSMQLYPHLYEDIDFEKIVLDFYQEVYNVELTIEELGI